MKEEPYGNEDVRKALIRLNDSIAEFERGSTIEATLILIPVRGKIEVSRSGKPVVLDPDFALELALRERDGAVPLRG